MKSIGILVKPISFNVIADGCSDLVIRLKGKRPNMIVGFSQESASFPMGLEARCFGIRFLPAGFTSLFGITACELTDRVELLDDVLPDFNAFIRNRIDENTPSEAVFSLLNEFLRKRVSNFLRTETRIIKALNNILSSSFTSLPIETGISSKHERRLFEEWVGDSPKVFEKIARFQQFIDMSINGIETDLPWVECGYYDQSHLIKDFKLMAGDTPKAFIKAIK